MQIFADKQKEALKLLHSDATHILLEGGRRSGKTYAIVSDCVATAYQYEGARILMGRQHLNHIKSSVWDQTLKDVLKEYPRGSYKLNHSDLTVKFFNDSEINLVGYDDKERIEKNLGREFCIIYNNECSTLSYDAILLAQSSLAQNIPGLKNKMYYDQNPPSPTHWTYKLFHEKVEPKSGDPLEYPEEYQYLLMNPMDNPHLSSDFIRTLDALPDRERRRYKYGEYVKPEGAIYSEFDVNTHTIEYENLPTFEYFTVGIDNTGTNFAAILIGWAGESLYVLDEYTAYRETMQNFDATIWYKWGQYSYVAYPDPAAAQLNDLVTNMAPADNAVEPGINYLKQKMQDNHFFLVRKDNRITTPQLMAELDSYRYDEKGRILKENDHLLDGLRYGTFSHAKYGGSILREV